PIDQWEDGRVWYILVYMANRTTFMPLRVKILSYAIYAIYCRAPTPQGWSGSFKQLPQAPVGAYLEKAISDHRSAHGS
ncbi:unnamed protein product, partial [marine sediment metagenome]